MTEDICVIIPSIRQPECIKTYLENARRHDFDVERLHIVFITEDFCDIEEMEQILEEEGVTGRVFSGSRREEWMEDNNLATFKHLIPEASHAQTSFGLLYMWANPRFDYGIFIDDDTLPHKDFNYFEYHLKNLAREEQTIEKVSSDKNWVNVLYQNIENHDLYPRGYPYSAMEETIEISEEVLTDEVVASQGLWTNIPDLDAVRILMDGDLKGQAQTLTSIEDFDRDFIVEKDNYLTVCSMNLAFKREVIPVFYQMPMDDNKWDVGRFDDIWSGVNLKKACDILGKQIYNGQPLCEHNKAERSTFGDLENEVAGLELNEHYWKIIDKVDTGQTYKEIALNIAEQLQKAEDRDYINAEFYKLCGDYLKDWVKAINRIEETL